MSGGNFKLLAEDEPAAEDEFMMEGAKPDFNLDQIDALTLPVQAKLLEVLEEKRVRRLGSSQAIPVYVRIIASSGEDLERLAAIYGTVLDGYFGP